MSMLIRNEVDDVIRHAPDDRCGYRMGVKVTCTDRSRGLLFGDLW